jgi:hypothetical protein
LYVSISIAVLITHLDFMITAHLILPFFIPKLMQI